MKKGFWRFIGKMPALALAAAVSPAVMADGPSVPYGYQPVGSAAGATAIPVVDMHAFRPIQPAIQPVSMDSAAYDTNAAPAPAAPAGPVPAAAAPVAPIAPPVATVPCAPATACAPSCYCGPEGGCTFQWAPDRWCNVGAGIRTSFSSVEGHEVNDKNYFAIDEARLFFTGKVTKVIGFELNTDISGAGGQGFLDSNGDRVNLPDSIHLLDAIVKFEFSDYVNFWVGRMLPPSDRANLSGPFYINGWDYPFVSNYPSVFEGRDDGIAYWGQYGGGQVKWQFGAYNGQGRFNAGNDWPVGASNAPNTTGNPEFAMRVVVNLLDPEPGYYNQSTYYGEKNIAAIGFALMDQTDALVDGNGRVGTFLGWNLDFLLENKMTAWGSGTLEAAYYNYDVGGDVANTVAGKAWFVFAGWLLPQPVGCGCCFCGRFRPWARYQRYDYDDATLAANDHAPSDEWDFGVDYVFCCANASKLTAFWGDRQDACGCREQIFRFGAQVVF